MKMQYDNENENVEIKRQTRWMTVFEAFKKDIGPIIIIGFRIRLKINYFK